MIHKYNPKYLWNQPLDEEGFRHAAFHDFSLQAAWAYERVRTGYHPAVDSAFDAAEQMIQVPLDIPTAFAGSDRDFWAAFHQQLGRMLADTPAPPLQQQQQQQAWTGQQAFAAPQQPQFGYGHAPQPDFRGMVQPPAKFQQTAQLQRFAPAFEEAPLSARSSHSGVVGGNTWVPQQRPLAEQRMTAAEFLPAAQMAAPVVPRLNLQAGINPPPGFPVAEQGAQARTFNQQQQRQKQQGKKQQRDNQRAQDFNAARKQRQQEQQQQQQFAEASSKLIGQQHTLLMQLTDKLTDKLTAAQAQMMASTQQTASVAQQPAAVPPAGAATPEAATTSAAAASPGNAVGGQTS